MSKSERGDPFNDELKDGTIWSAKRQKNIFQTMMGLDINPKSSNYATVFLDKSNTSRKENIEEQIEKQINK